MPDVEKVVNALEWLLENMVDPFNDFMLFDYDEPIVLANKPIIEDALALLKALDAFKSYFDGLYGQGLDVENYHLNGATEPFDNFYDSAMEEYENAKRADTQRDYQTAVEMTEYCERYESTYNQEDGSM